MITKSIRMALVLTAATMVLSGGCGGGGGGGGPFVQLWGEAAPNTTLAEFLDEAAGEKTSVTQHTGSMTLSDSNEVPNSIDALIFDFLIDGDPPDLAGGTLAAIADGSDENPAHFRITDTDDNDFIFRIDSTGNLEMVVVSEEGVDPFIHALGVKDLDAELDVGDDFASLFLSIPGEPGPAGDLDFMAVVAWATFETPSDTDTEITVDFGVGHTGLVTPEEDMPVAGDAVYIGDFTGLYVEPGEDAFIGFAEGDAVFTAEFGDGTVDGGVSSILVTGIDLGEADGIDFDAVTISGNTFSGGVVPGEGGFAAFGELSTGTLDGTFYGPVVGDGSEEAGVVLTLQDSASDDFITGVIGASLVD